MLHVLEDHDEWVTITTYAIKLDNVLMLQVGEQLCLPLEILTGCQGGVFQCLKEGSQIRTGWAHIKAKPEQTGLSIAEKLVRKGGETTATGPVAPGGLVVGAGGISSAFCSCSYRPSRFPNSFPRQQQTCLRG